MGFQSGIAQSSQLNKVWRQSSIMSAMLAQFICDKSGQNAIDDGTFASLLANFEQALGGAGRTKLTTNLNLFVSTSGSNTNTGTSSSSPLRTLSAAAAVANSAIDTQGFNVIVNISAGNYADTVWQQAPLVGGGLLSFVGNTSNPSSVVVTALGTSGCFIAQCGARVSVAGMTLVTPSGFIGNVFDCGSIAASLGAEITFANIIFSTAASSSHIAAVYGGLVYSFANYTITAGATAHLFASHGGHLKLGGGSATVTLQNLPAFSAFAYCWNASTIESPSGGFNPAGMYSGSATGARYVVNNNAIIETSGAGANWFPGSTAGSAINGGIYA